MWLPYGGEPSMNDWYFRTVRALLTKRKSPMRRVFSILPDGILNASTRNVRRKNQTTSATTIDLAQSQTQITNDRECSAVRAVMKKHPQWNGRDKSEIYHHIRRLRELWWKAAGPRPGAAG